MRQLENKRDQERMGLWAGGVSEQRGEGIAGRSGWREVSEEKEHEVTAQEERGLQQDVCGAREKALDMLSFTCSRKHLNLGDSLPQRLHTFRGRLGEGEVLGVVRAWAWGTIAHQRLQLWFNVQLELQENIIHQNWFAICAKTHQYKDPSLASRASAVLCNY